MNRDKRHAATVTQALTEEKREEKIEETLTPAPANSQKRPTLEQAKAAAAQDGIQEDLAVQWWHAREASDWIKSNGHGGNVSVGSWRSDLKSYSMNVAQSKADKRPPHRQGEFPEPQLRNIKLPQL